MNKMLLPALLVLALAACGDKAAEPTAATPAAATDAKAPKAPKARVVVPGDALPTALPAGVQLSFPYHFRADETSELSPGRNQRRVTVEFLQGNVPKTMRTIRADLKAAGFRLPVRTELDGGRERFELTKKGWGRVIVTVLPKGSKVQHPNARGTVRMIWIEQRPQTP